MELFDQSGKEVKLLATITMGIIMICIGAFIALTIGEMFYETLSTIYMKFQP